MKCKICGNEIPSSRANGTTCSVNCSIKEYWLERINNQNSKTQAVINHKVYQIKQEDTCGYRGFDGALFYIEFFDRRKVRTTNLWSNGDIPDEFINQLPDNAKFINEEEYENE